MENKVYRVKKDVDGPMDIKFKKGENIQIVRNMVYMGGFPVSQNYQTAVINWISDNQKLLTDIT